MMISLLRGIEQERMIQLWNIGKQREVSAGGGL